MADLDVRPRRLRRSASMRSLVRETEVSRSHLLQPLFVCPGEGVRRPLASLPGQAHLSPDQAAAVAVEIHERGGAGVILFGLPSFKDAQGSSAWDEQGPVQEAIRRIKGRNRDVLVATDVCLCEYTDHGHCGLVEGETVLNDETLPLLARMAVSHARAGADIVAPSDMMDGRVRAIRQGLDADAYAQVAIMAYSAKFASSFYGPFREAAESTPTFGDRRTYQMDPANGREALREARLDLAEGADIIMVKPAMPYLDVLTKVAALSDRPVAAYQVSGEYAMIEAAAQNGWIDRERARDEALLSIHRAGADIIISYYTAEICGLHI